MSVLISNTLSGTSGFSGLVACESNGTANYGTLAVPPVGIDGRVWFDPAPDGSPALHCRTYQTDAIWAGGRRAEVVLGEDQLLGAGVFNAPFFYAWEMYIPSSWPKTGNAYACMQLHDWPDNGEAASWPNLELMIQGSELVAKVSSNFFAISSEAYDWARVPAVFDRWVKCAVFAKWDKTATTGFMELIYDGKQVDKRWNVRSSRDDAKGPFMKLGVYDCLSNNDFGILEAWYRNLKFMDGADGYVAAIGSSPKASGHLALSD